MFDLSHPSHWQCWGHGRDYRSRQKVLSNYDDKMNLQRCCCQLCARLGALDYKVLQVKKPSIRKRLSMSASLPPQLVFVLCACIGSLREMGRGRGRTSQMNLYQILFCSLGWWNYAFSSVKGWFFIIIVLKPCPFAHKAPLCGFIHHCYPLGCGIEKWVKNI